MSRVVPVCVVGLLVLAAAPEARAPAPPATCSATISLAPLVKLKPVKPVLAKPKLHVKPGRTIQQILDDPLG